MDIKKLQAGKKVVVRYLDTNINGEFVKKLREKYNIAKDKFVVLAVGQLQKRKGVLDFIQIARSMPNIEFVWAGGAVFGKMSEGYDEIMNIINGDLPSNVKFLGLIDRDDMNEVYNMSDVMFLPSYEELFPMSILEAMCVNIPILTRDLDIYNGILFDFYCFASDNNGFINMINRLKNDKEYYDTMVEKSKAGNAFYCKDNVKNMWKDLLIFYLTSFVFGGAAFALIYIVKPQDILMKNGLFLGTYPLKTVVLRSNNSIFDNYNSI